MLSKIDLIKMTRALHTATLPLDGGLPLINAKRIVDAFYAFYRMEHSEKLTTDAYSLDLFFVFVHAMFKLL